MLFAQHDCGSRTAATRVTRSAGEPGPAVARLLESNRKSHILQSGDLAARPRASAAASPASSAKLARSVAPNLRGPLAQRSSGHAGSLAARAAPTSAQRSPAARPHAKQSAAVTSGLRSPAHVDGAAKRMHHRQGAQVRSNRNQRAVSIAPSGGGTRVAESSLHAGNSSFSAMLRRASQGGSSSNVHMDAKHVGGATSLLLQRSTSGVVEADIGHVAPGAAPGADAVQHAGPPCDDSAAHGRTACLQVHGGGHVAAALPAPTAHVDLAAPQRRASSAEGGVDDCRGFPAGEEDIITQFLALSAHL